MSACDVANVVLYSWLAWPVLIGVACLIASYVIDKSSRNNRRK